MEEKGLNTPAEKLTKEEIKTIIAGYFNVSRGRAAQTEVNIPSLDQSITLQLEGREVYVSIPFDPNAPKPDFEAITEYARQYKKARLLLWLNGEIKEL